MSRWTGKDAWPDIGYPTLMREMVEGDIGKVEVPIDTNEAHKLVGLKIFGLYYEAARLYEGKDCGSFMATKKDEARGELFIAICEWARSKGAVL